ncbi:MAG: hypothetical protein HWN68_02365 [Desulfobacterales bacterium]|nr:hypothetical protein [Desulfobacterales bacterium]
MEKADETKLESLEAELAKLVAPPVPEPVIPFDIDKEKNLVLARKYNGEKIAITSFKAEGLWLPVFDYFSKQQEIMDQMESILKKYPEYDVVVEEVELGEEELQE